VVGFLTVIKLLVSIVFIYLQVSTSLGQVISDTTKIQGNSYLIGLIPSHKSNIYGLGIKFSMWEKQPNIIIVNGLLVDLQAYQLIMPIVIIPEILLGWYTYKQNSLTDGRMSIYQMSFDTISFIPVLPKVENDINGVALSIFDFDGYIRNNGISIGLLTSSSIRSNGFSFSGIINNKVVSKGVMISLLTNLSYDFSGIQIGLFNNTKFCRGFQFGLYNIIDGKGFPLLNWKF